MSDNQVMNLVFLLGVLLTFLLGYPACEQYAKEQALREQQQPKVEHIQRVDDTTPFDLYLWGYQNGMF